VSFATSNSAFTTTSTSFTDVTGMSVSYTVPEGATKLIAYYSVECAATGGSSGNYVAARILIDGVEMDPVDATPVLCTVSYDWTTYHDLGAAIVRTDTVTPGSTITVKVQAKSQSSSTTADLDDMTLMVMSGS
jgi:hypothetical protein